MLPKRRESWKILQCKAYRQHEVRERIAMLMQTYSLKLKLYRSLGIDADPDSAGAYNKATIRNTQKGDVHVVNIDSKFSKFFYANYFWQNL